MTWNQKRPHTGSWEKIRPQKKSTDRQHRKRQRKEIVARLLSGDGNILTKKGQAKWSDSTWTWFGFLPEESANVNYKWREQDCNMRLINSQGIPLVTLSEFKSPGQDELHQPHWRNWLKNFQNHCSLFSWNHGAWVKCQVIGGGQSCPYLQKVQSRGKWELQISQPDLNQRKILEQVIKNNKLC